MRSPSQATQTSQSEHGSMTRYKQLIGVSHTLTGAFRCVQSVQCAGIVLCCRYVNHMPRTIWTVCIKPLRKMPFPGKLVGNGVDVCRGSASNCVCTCRSGSQGLRHHRITCHRVHWRALISHLYSRLFHFSIARAVLSICFLWKRAFILVRESRLGLPCRPKTIWLEIDYTVALNTQFNCVEQCILSSRLSTPPFCMWISKEHFVALSSGSLRATFRELMWFGSV